MSNLILGNFALEHPYYSTLPFHKSPVLQFLLLTGRKFFWNNVGTLLCFILRHWDSRKK